MTRLIWPTIALALASASERSDATACEPSDHLYSRCTFGPGGGARSDWLEHGPDAWYDRQVAAGNRLRAAATTAAGSASQHSDEAQLYEVLVDFFGTHFDVPQRDRDAHDRDVVRRYATGSFTSMLLASARNPAMLAAAQPARDLLSRHTVAQGYTEQDVRGVDRLLTGRVLDADQRYVYDQRLRLTGPVRVLDFAHANACPAGGEQAGDALLRYLAAHPATAARLARALCARLVSDTPSAALVDAVAQAYLAGHTQIMPMVSTILRSTEFWESRCPKTVRPRGTLRWTTTGSRAEFASLSVSVESLRRAVPPAAR